MHRPPGNWEERFLPDSKDWGGFVTSKPSLSEKLVVGDIKKWLLAAACFIGVVLLAILSPYYMVKLKVPHWVGIPYGYVLGLIYYRLIKRIFKNESKEDAS